MKDTFLTFPEPLRKRILLQCAGAGLGITMLLILLVYVRDWYFLFPCAALVIVSLSGAASLYDRCRQKRYVTIEAACTEINRMPSAGGSNPCICAANSTPSNWSVSEKSVALRLAIP